MSSRFSDNLYLKKGAKTSLVRVSPGRFRAQPGNWWPGQLKVMTHEECTFISAITMISFIPTFFKTKNLEKNRKESWDAASCFHRIGVRGGAGNYHRPGRIWYNNDSGTAHSASNSSLCVYVHKDFEYWGITCHFISSPSWSADSEFFNSFIIFCCSGRCMSRYIYRYPVDMIWYDILL